jgi:hypothetical protein
MGRLPRNRIKGFVEKRKQTAKQEFRLVRGCHCQSVLFSWKIMYIRTGETMPAVPHYPSDEPDRKRRAPDISDVVDRILDRDDPSPVVTTT